MALKMAFILKFLATYLALSTVNQHRSDLGFQTQCLPKITFCTDLPITFVIKDPQNFHKRELISKMRLQKHQRCPIPVQSISGQRVLKCETCGCEKIVEILNYTFNIM